jgi:peptidoglycan/LPS O-acetylase OafA/YrhL
MNSKNNFDFLRHLLAFSVVFHHFNVLTSNDVSFIFFDVINSNVAVKAFFVISGLLIWISANRSKNKSIYFRKRFFRLYPALFFILLISSIVALLIFDQPITEIVKYFSWNAIFLNFMNPCIGTMFDSNVICAVNGALWTLKLEVAYYIFIGISVFFFKNIAYRLVVIFSVISFVLESYLYFTPESIGQEFHNQIIFKFYYFGLGVILYSYEKFMSTINLLIALVLALIGWKFFGVDFLFLPVFTASLVFLVAFRLPAFKFCKYGDLSYGLYIYHFPLIQLFVYKNWFTGNYLVDFVVFTLILLVLSKASWDFIEKKSINYGHNFLSK